MQITTFKEKVQSKIKDFSSNITHVLLIKFIVDELKIDKKTPKELESELLSDIEDSKQLNEKQKKEAIKKINLLISKVKISYNKK
jgi:hypothetical protein